MDNYIPDKFDIIGASIALMVVCVIYYALWSLNLVVVFGFIVSGVNFRVYLDESIYKIQSEMMMNTIFEF
jgi:hypothetical protein